MELEEYHLVILRRADSPPALTDAQLDELQVSHLSYLGSLSERGVLALNGPLVNQPDVTMRGLSFYCTTTAQEAVELAEGDPMVKAGRLRVELMQFWTKPGSIAVSGNYLTVD